MVVSVGKQHWNNRRVDDKKVSTSGTYNLQVDVCRVVGRKFTGVGQPHDKFANNDVRAVNDSIVFVRSDHE